MSLFLAFSSASHAADSASAASARHEARYERLAHELRCLVCQNQSLAESGAELAGDLKREVRRLIIEEKSDAEIKSFLVQRFGDFVLYDPPFKASTLLLWLGPGLLLVFGLLLARGQFKRRHRAVPPIAQTPGSPPAASDSTELQKELDRMLK